jgi:hypothetical protein
MVTGTSVTKSGGKYSRYIRIGQYIESVWNGKTSERLGIAGKPVDEASFQALTDLKNPETGEQLKRKHKQKITLWDLTVSAPKSASILALYDPAIRDAHYEAAAKLPGIWCTRNSTITNPGQGIRRCIRIRPSSI